jgi:hypothetical protein
VQGLAIKYRPELKKGKKKERPQQEESQAYLIDLRAIERTKESAKVRAKERGMENGKGRGKERAKERARES